MSEQWRPIPGFDGYEASSLGRIRSWKRRGGPGGSNPGTRLIKGRRTQPHLPYLQVNIYPTGSNRPVNRTIHRLVAAAFHGPCPTGLVVRHLDGNGANNIPANLAYGTRGENVADSVRHGTHPQASKTHCKRGHEFTPENTKLYQRRWGTERICRECTRLRLSSGRGAVAA